MAAQQEGFSFRVVEGWGSGLGGRAFGGVTPAVATDSRDRVYIARREPAAILVYGGEGDFLGSWGADLLQNPHSVWFNGKDELYVCDVDDHTVRKFDTEGRVLQTLGTAARRVGLASPSINRRGRSRRRGARYMYQTDTASFVCTVLRRTGGSCTRGAKRARVPASLACRTVCVWTAAGGSWCWTGRTGACRYSMRRVCI